MSLRRLAALFFLFGAVIVLATGCSTPRAPFYPIGIYSVSNTNDFRTVSEAGFNLVAGSANAGYLDAARQANLKVLASPHTSAGPNFNAAAARRAVSAFDSHPALWAWYLIDEPDLHRVDPRRVTEANRYLKWAGAKKPTALVLFQGSTAIDYAHRSDILMIDRYPIPWLPLANFPQHIRLGRLALGKEKPLIAVIQAFDWTYYPDLLSEKNLRPPTYSELRCMTYSALVQRANGIFYYCFNDGRWKMEEHPETWQALKTVVAEVQQRRPLFQAEHVWWPYAHGFSDPAKRFNSALESSIMPALLRVKRGDENVPAGDYILAVNNTPEEHKYELTVPEGVTVAVPVLGEDRLVPVVKGRIYDTFAPFAVHVYGPLALSP